MSDFEQLRRNPDNDSDKTRVEAVYQVKEEKPSLPIKKPTVFSVLLATIKRDKAYLENVNAQRPLPTLSYTVLTFFVVLAIALTLVICFFSLDLMRFIPLVVIACALLVPSLLLVFYYELNADKSFVFFKFALTFALGLFFYLIVSFINNGILYSISFYSNVEAYVFPVIYTLILFAFTFLLANAYKATSLSACFLISVTLAMSYFIIDTLIKNFSLLFITVRREELIEGYLYPSINAVVNETSYLEQSVSNLFDRWFLNYIFMPYMFAGWAMITGAVVSTSLEVRNKKGNPPRIVFLLLMLVIFFQYITDTSTSVNIFDYILNVLAFMGTTYVSVRFLNTYLIQ